MPILNRSAHNKTTLGDHSFYSTSSFVSNTIKNDVRCALSLQMSTSCLKSYLLHLLMKTEQFYADEHTHVHALAILMTYFQSSLLLMQ